MKNKEYHIKGMVCARCLKVLKNEWEAIGVNIKALRMGFAELEFDSEKITESELEEIIENNGFEIIRNKEKILAEQTKIWVIKYARQTEMTHNLSCYLEENLGVSYQVLSRNFSKIFGQTIERFLLLLKIEMAKESIALGEDNFTQIAFSLGYENLSALSRQFKKETGLTMRDYQHLGKDDRIMDDEILSVH